MPWTLYRYILTELLKLLLLTTGVLVLLMSFAAAIQPISDGLLSPTLLAKFIAFTAPTVLGFALPFAGAFASTLVFIRLANDNEILACSASGLSYQRILVPVLALGLLLTAGMFYLSNSVVPSFFRMAERTVDSDVISVLVSRLDQSQPFELRDQGIVIYADAAEEFPPVQQADSKLPMKQLVQLVGVAVGETDNERNIRQDTTAQSATLMVYGDDDGEASWVRLQLQGVVRYDPATGGLGRVESLTSRPIQLPSAIGDSPKFLSSDDLVDLLQNPQDYDSVQIATQELASALATENLRQSLIAKMQTGRDDPAVLHGVLSGDRYVLQAPSIIEQGDALLLESNNNDPVRLELFINSRIDGQPTRIYEAQSATLEVRTNGLSPDPTIDLELNDVTVTGINQGPRGGDKSIPIRQLSWPTSILQQGDGQVRPNEFISMAELPMYADSDRVGQMVDRVQSEIADLGRRITGLRHERAASAVSCALLLVLGALLSLRLRGQMPLVVYFWSFLLAIITIIIVGSGQNVIGSLDMPVAIGVVLLWSGNGMLLTVILLLYLRIAKH